MSAHNIPVADKVYLEYTRGHLSVRRQPVSGAVRAGSNPAGGTSNVDAKTCCDLCLSWISSVRWRLAASH
jgi:hypothetical protein